MSVDAVKYWLYRQTAFMTRLGVLYHECIWLHSACARQTSNLGGRLQAGTDGLHWLQAGTDGLHWLQAGTDGQALMDGRTCDLLV